MEDEEVWRTETLNRVPTKLFAHQVLVHNRVKPPGPNAKPSSDSFSAWILHPVDRGQPAENPFDPCTCGWLPGLGPHFVFPGEGWETPVPDLRVEDVLAPMSSDQVEPYDGFLLITGTFDTEGGGDACVIDPDGRVCRVSWSSAAAIEFEELQSPEVGRYWSSEAVASDLLRSHLPDLKCQWEAWRSTQGD
jgi:hypothetical protein